MYQGRQKVAGERPKWLIFKPLPLDLSESPKGIKEAKE